MRGFLTPPCLRAFYYFFISRRHDDHHNINDDANFPASTVAEHMDTSSDSDGLRSPGVYGQMAYSAAAATGYDDPTTKSPSSRHSESSGSGSAADEPCAKAGHHKFSIDRILGRFSGGDATTAVHGQCVRETSPDPGNSHRNELSLRGPGECIHDNTQ